jgi:uncharacterized protein (TIGR02808 family)
LSSLESVIWHVLGYAAIPLVVIAGVVISTLFYLLMMKLIGRDTNE